MVTQSPLVVGVDCSTHGAKAVAWSLHGDPVADASAPFLLSNPKRGWWEQHADDWISATRHALSSLPAEVRGAVAAVAVTHQRETFVGLDREGRPVRPAIVWMDERAQHDVEALRHEIGEDRFHRITGKPLSLTPSVTKIRWLRRHEPDAFAAAHRWCDVQAVLVRDLTAQDVTSYGSAGPMGLVDLARQDWSDAVLDAVGVRRDQLPSLAPPGSIVGTLTSEAASATGLANRTPVVVTAGDGQVAALGAGIVDLRAAYLNLGTAIVAGTISSTYRVDRAFRTMAGAMPGTYLLESDLKGGTFTIDWLRERVLSDAWSLPALEREAAGVSPGAEGLVLLPYFAGVMDPHWDDDASGVLLGLRGDHGPGHLFRAVIEGIAMEERLHFEHIEAATGVRIERVHVLGGGASSDLWCQILADVLDRPVVRTSSPEATSLGAAMLGAAAIGACDAAGAATSMGGLGRCFDPGEVKVRYADLYAEVHAGLYPALRDLMGKLSRLARMGDDGAPADF